MEHPPEIAPPEPVLIIAEAGVNHNGQPALALKLCDAALEAGADMVKFQTWKTEALLLKETPMAGYQQHYTGSAGSQFDMAKALELSQHDFVQIKAHCDNIGIKFLSTPDEEVSLNFLTDGLGLELIKIGSAEVTNIPFLRQTGMKGCDVILSTGMADMEEVETAFRTLLDYGAKRVRLLHCTSNYPAPFGEVNLRVIQEMRERFLTAIGYSDHTEGTEVAIAAVALGAGIIEKHLTLNRTMEGPDHQASIEPWQFRQMVDAIRHVEAALGERGKVLQPSEREVRTVVAKSLVARTAIQKGETYTMDKVTSKRAGSKGILASRWPEVEGKSAPCDLLPDDLIVL